MFDDCSRVYEISHSSRVEECLEVDGGVLLYAYFEKEWCGLGGEGRVYCAEFTRVTVYKVRHM